MSQGVLVMTAYDMLDTSDPPPDATGYVVVGDDEETASFGTNTSVSFTLDYGTYTVGVRLGTGGAGYKPDEDPNTSGQVSNPNNSEFGNPRYVTVGATTPTPAFRFWPLVTARGRVKDKNTGSWIQGATLEFTANSGSVSGTTYTKYPNAASWSTAWATDADGKFPTDVHLPSVGYDLVVKASGYRNNSKSNVISSSCSPGDIINLGDIPMDPV